MGLMALPQVGSTLEGGGPMPGLWGIFSVAAEAKRPVLTVVLLPQQTSHSNPAPWLSPLHSPLP